MCRRHGLFKLALMVALMGVVVPFVFIAIQNNRIGRMFNEVRAQTTVRDGTSSGEHSISKFIWVGRPNDQFTDEQFEALAKNYDLVVLAKFHAEWDHEKHDAAARKLKELNPNIKVLIYFPMSYRFRKDTYGQTTFKDEWVLYDQKTDEPIKHRNGQDNYIDLSNPEYRSWVIQIITTWMNSAPYDGVAFDNTNPIGLGSRQKTWEEQVGRDKIEAWNKGLTELLTETKELLGDKLVLYNGFARKDWRVNRNLDLLAIADGALNEDFCYVRPQGGYLLSKTEILEDIALQITYGAQQKIILQKTNYRDTLSGSKKEQVSRYCLGSFLLGYQPGYTFYKFGPSYNTRDSEIEENALEIDLNLGQPEGRYQQASTVFKRKFENGWVFVNMEQTPNTITIPEPLVLMNRGQVGPRYEPGQTLRIPANDAAFLLKPEAILSPSPTGTPIQDQKRDPSN